MFSKDKIQQLYNELIQYEEIEKLHTKARQSLLDTGLSKANIPKNIKMFRTACIIYKACNFNIDNFVGFIFKYKKYKKITLRDIKTAFIRIFNTYFDLAQIKYELQKSKGHYHKIDKSVDRVKKVLSFFNLHTDTLKEKLRKIYIGEEIPQEEYLKELYTLRQLFLAKAKGEITQTTTSVVYEIEEDENGEIIKQRVYENKNGKKLINVEYKSQLPDEKSLVALRVIDEMIIQASVDSGDTITDEELEKMYDNYLQNINNQRKEYMLIEEKGLK